MNTRYYDYLAASKVECPKCGHISEISLHSNSGRTLEYFGICESQLDSGGRCSTTLALQVVAHQFPVQPS